MNPDDLYVMTHKKRGKCVIINNKNFTGHGYQSISPDERHGTDTDAKNLQATFKQLGFETELHSDQTCRQIYDCLVAVSQEDHHNSDCFVCVLLSHGGDGLVWGADSGTINIETLLQPLKGDQCPSLIGKPKVFIVQTCKDTQTTEEADASAEYEEYDTRKQQTIPAEADILYVNSTIPGKWTWGKGGQGSLFIDSLCDVLQKHGTTKDIMWMLTRVNHEVAQKWTSLGKDKHTDDMDIPLIVSMLTKDLVF